ncbi:MAG: superoxide dismutase [Acidimicrobiia bacterium]|nr:superoxide dismutase [Acidimicrobiia bacterium]MDH3470754.1 superoxide dismutase [Acidimicrobiia bacterium]
MKRVILVVSCLVLLLTAAVPAAAKPVFPELIPLPTAFQPEGIAVGSGHTFFAGSLADGSIVSGDLRTGESHELVAGEEGRIAVGMSFDARSGYLFVAGGLNGVGRVYDTGSGSLIAEYPMASGGQFGDFINDVIVTRTAAYFTNSFAPELHRVPLGPAGDLISATAEPIALTGDWEQVPGPFVFNANGIEATPNGTTLFVVNSTRAAVYAVDPATGVATQLDLGGEEMPAGDGLVLVGKTLYVVQNQLNQIGVVSLDPDSTAGLVGNPITSPHFVVPTTAAAFGSSLYAINAKFGTPPAGTAYELVRVARP